MTKIEEILIDFQAMGITTSAIKLAFDLDQGSIEIANISDNPEMITLLKIIRTFPWLLEVAEYNYDENISKRTLLHNAVDVIMNKQYNDKLKEKYNGKERNRMQNS